MDSTNCKPKITIVYTSATGNTKELADLVYDALRDRSADVTMERIDSFSLSRLQEADAVVVGTYSWGNGELPREMRGLFKAFEQLGRKDLVTAVFGTGDSFYPNYCGAVDRFRDMLYVHTELAVTLKVELLPQPQDTARCEKFADLLLARLSQ